MHLQVIGQEPIPGKKEAVFYPLNIPHALFGKFRASLELPVKTNSLVFGAHYNRKLDFEVGKGAGGAIQYRIDFNKDPNIFFKQKDYWGFEISHDRLHSVNKGPNYHWETDIKLTYIGLMVGLQLDFNKTFILDGYISAGIAPYSYEEVDYYYEDWSYSGVYPYGSIGIQFGFKL